MNIFALVEEEGSLIKRVLVSGDLQDELERYLLEQKNRFYTNQDEINFTGSYNVEEGEIFCIRDFPPDASITSALENPLNYDPLDLRGDPPKIKALFAGKWTNLEKFICFQSIDSRRMLARNKFALLHSGDTFTKLEHPGIVLQDRLTALFEENKLLFSSYHSTQRFLDLSNYYAEATDADLDQFAGEALMQIDDIPLFKVNSDTIIRKKIALLQKNNVLATLSPDVIREKAIVYNVELNIDNGKIVIPDNRKQLKELVRFLDEDYFTAPLTQRRCLTNSKQYLP